jgi:hypothetical protein
MVLNVNSDYSLVNVNQSIFVTVKCGVLFEVRTDMQKLEVCGTYVSAHQIYIISIGQKFFF